MVHIFLTIFIMHHIFLFSFGTIKNVKFQNYYLNSHYLKEIIMITKTYHIITIDIILSSVIKLLLSQNTNYCRDISKGKYKLE